MPSSHKNNSTRSRGARGEELAARYLIEKGFILLDRNYRDNLSRGEIDLIARIGTCLVFIEVKAGRGSAFGSPESWVDARKQMRIARAANRYLQDHLLQDAECRFDVIGIHMDRKPPEVVHIEQAFWSVL